LRLRASFRTCARLLAQTARAGGAWLGVGLLVSSAEPFEVLAVAAAAITLVGGIAANARWHVSVRLAACAATVLLARVLTGPASAGGVTVLIAFGWWIRMRPWDAITGLSIFGIGAAAIGMASVRLFAFFWSLGAASIGGARAWRSFRSGRLRDETTSAPPLARENPGAPAPAS
jgi:hypothetical protein